MWNNSLLVLKKIWHWRKAKLSSENVRPTDTTTIVNRCASYIQVELKEDLWNITSNLPIYYLELHPQSDFAISFQCINTGRSKYCKVVKAKVKLVNSHSLSMSNTWKAWATDSPCKCKTPNNLTHLIPPPNFHQKKTMQDQNPPDFLLN